MVQTSAKPSTQVWNGFREHSSTPRTETYFAILDSLRWSHPDHLVTVVPGNAGLIKYADANKDKGEAVLDDEDEKYVVWRTYYAGDRRSGTSSGEVKDDVKFGRYCYTWNGHEFIVYHANYIVDYTFERSQEFYFVLYDRSKLAANETRPKPVDELIASATKWNEDLHGEVWMYDRECWTKSKKLWQSVEQSGWDDVILDPEVKKSLINDVQGFFDNEAEYREFAVAFKRGIILHGPPGNGKSLTIKALMHSLSTREEHIPTLYVKSFAGCHQEWYNIREVFEKARASTPCLLIFEDLDSMVTEKVRSFFLNEVDGLEDNDGLMIIGSTNYLEKLDPSITKRPSRFDRKYRFALPAHSERVQYAEYWRNKLAKNQRVGFPEGLSSAIADVTEGFSFAYLKEVFITSLLAIVGAKRLGVDEPEGLDEVNGEGGDDINGTADKLQNDLLWRVIRKQVDILRAEMEEAQASEDKPKGKDSSAKEGKENDCEDGYC